jgi:predicted ATPase
MIKEITIKGFKSFFDETIRIAPLTVLTGLNSSGKSSILQAIRILGNVSNGYSNPLLEGHGSIEELQNQFVKTPFSLEALYDGPNGKESIIKYSAEGHGNHTDGYPSLIYVSADRFGPQTSIPILSDYKLGERGENVLNCIDHYWDTLLNPILIHEKSQGETFEFNLGAWLGAISPGVRFKSHILKATDSSYSLFNDHRAKNVGFGLSYTLPIIVALFLGTIEKDTAVLIENPEAHLHPKGQTELARLICLAVEAGAQIIVETHSDHLFDGIRIFTKQHKGFAKKVCLNWFELDEDKLTTVESPELQQDGRLSEWPTGLFDQFGINASELLKP